MRAWQYEELAIMWVLKVSVWIGHQVDSYLSSLHAFCYRTKALSCFSVIEQECWGRSAIEWILTYELRAFRRQTKAYKYSQSSNKSVEVLSVIKQECQSESAIEQITTYHLRAFLSENKSIELRIRSWNWFLPEVYNGIPTINKVSVIEQNYTYKLVIKQIYMSNLWLLRKHSMQCYAMK